MRVRYVSPVFEGHVFMVPLEGLKYFQKRDAAVLALKQLGGLNAPDTEEVRKYRRAILSARRAIERNGFYATPAIPAGV